MEGTVGSLRDRLRTRRRRRAWDVRRRRSFDDLSRSALDCCSRLSPRSAVLGLSAPSFRFLRLRRNGRLRLLRSDLFSLFELELELLRCAIIYLNFLHHNRHCSVYAEETTTVTAQGPYKVIGPQLTVDS